MTNVQRASWRKFQSCRRLSLSGPHESLRTIAEKLETALGSSLKKMKDAHAKEQLTLNITGDIGLMRDGIVPENMLKYASFATETAYLG